MCIPAALKRTAYILYHISTSLVNYFFMFYLSYFSFIPVFQKDCRVKCGKFVGFPLLHNRSK